MTARNPGFDDHRTHWFSELAEHMGAAYERYSFTKGTDQEVAALIELLDLHPGQRILDVGCGTGRHCKALAAAGFDVVGVDISPRFVSLASEQAGPNELYLHGDARALAFDAEFDGVISLCQGAFGLTGGPGAEDTLPMRELDEAILEGIAAALKPGAKAAVSAFSAYFQLRHGDAPDSFDARLGVNHEHTEVRNDAGVPLPAELWTTCFTPRELRLMARATGLRPLAVYGVTPGGYGRFPPGTDEPEFLLLVERSAAHGR
jgi:SAM-dependent methyltransferase